jgi:hypothetical protein
VISASISSAVRGGVPAAAESFCRVAQEKGIEAFTFLLGD